MMLPDFLVIGAEKCGTTSLYHYLREHPSVFMCTPKEPDYFSGEGYFQSLEAYEALFDEATVEQVAGEATPRYLHSAAACRAIAETIPDVRLIAIIRDPAERAYSHHNMMVAHGAISKEPYLDVLRSAQRSGDYYGTGIPNSRYAEPLRRYMDRFGDQMRVYLFSDFKRDTAGVVQSVFEHIGVDPSFEPQTERRYNEASLPKSEHANRLLSSANVIKRVAKAVLPGNVRSRLRQLLHRANQASVPPLSEEARALILDMIYEDIEQTEQILGRDLTAWKQKHAA